MSENISPLRITPSDVANGLIDILDVKGLDLFIDFITKNEKKFTPTIDKYIIDYYIEEVKKESVDKKNRQLMAKINDEIKIWLQESINERINSMDWGRVINKIANDTSLTMERIKLVLKKDIFDNFYVLFKELKAIQLTLVNNENLRNQIFNRIDKDTRKDLGISKTSEVKIDDKSIKLYLENMDEKKQESLIKIQEDLRIRLEKTLLAEMRKINSQSTKMTGEFLKSVLQYRKKLLELENRYII